MFIQIQLFRPNTFLSRFIESYRIGKVDPQVINHVWVDFPNTNTDMLFCFSGQLCILPDGGLPILAHKHFFLGHFHKHYQVIPLSETHFLNIRFKPTGIYPFIQIPLKEFTDTGTSLDHLMGAWADQLYELLISSTHPETQIRMLEYYLEKRLSGYTDVDSLTPVILKYAEQHKGVVSVSDLCQLTGVGHKKMSRLLLKKVGLPPKALIRTIRIRNILQDLDINHSPDWMDIVARYNFHDQSHLIKEFKYFTGQSPSQYLFKRKNSNHIRNHSPGPVQFLQ